VGLIEILNWFAASGWRAFALFAFTLLVFQGLEAIIRAGRK
jgi:hypothetical protein